MADALCNEMHIVTLSDTDEVLVYENGVYIKGGESKIAATIEKTLQLATLSHKANLNFIRETIGHIKRRTYRLRTEFDTDPYIINVKNGLLDIRSESIEFKAHTPEYLSIVQLPVKYNQNAECPKCLKFVNEILYHEDVAVLQEIGGSILWRDYPTQKAILLVGEGGNGKSTLIEVIKTLLGKTCISSRSLQELQKNRFAKADLHAKLANVYADLDDEELRYVGTFKMLTGGDPITAEHKFRNSFDFTNYAKLIFSANRVPEVYEDTLAFFRRWLIINFPNIFTETERENKNLRAELTTEQELSGFFNWFLEGLKRLRTNHWRFSNSRSTTEIREDYIRRSSPIQAFLIDCVQENAKGDIVKQDLFKEYCEYCRQHHLPPGTSDRFWKRLPEFLSFGEAKIEKEVVDVEKGVQVTKHRRRNCITGHTLREREDWGKGRDDSEDSDEEKTGQSGQAESSKGVQPVKGSGYLDSHNRQTRIDEPVTDELLSEVVAVLRSNLPRLKLREHEEVVEYLEGTYGHELATCIVERLKPRFHTNPEGFLELI